MNRRYEKRLCDDCTPMFLKAILYNVFHLCLRWPITSFLALGMGLLSKPIKMDLRGLEQYCAEMGVRVQCVPAGFGLVPPSIRLPELDHNPDLRENQEQVKALFDLGGDSSDAASDESDAFM